MRLCPSLPLLASLSAGILVLAAPFHARADDEGSSDSPTPNESSDESPSNDSPTPAAAPERAPETEADSSSDEAPRNEGIKAAIGTDPDQQVGVVRVKKRKSAKERAVTDPGPINPAAAARRIQLFTIPLGDNAGLALTPTQLAIEGEVNKLPGFHPVDLVKELAQPTPPPILAKLDEAARAIEDGNKQLDEHQYAEAGNRYGHAIDLMSENAAYITTSELAEAIVRRAVALQYAGEDDAAKQAFRLAARVDLGKRVKGRKVDPDLGIGLEHARKDIAGGPVGSLSVVTAPAGSRVFVGGVYRGISPITVDRLPIGANYVLVDRPGAQAVARLIEVKEATDTPFKLKTAFSQETVDLQNMLEQVPASLGREKGLPDMVRSLGRRFKLERAVIATVRIAQTNVAEVRVAVFDLLRETRLADEHAVFSTESETGLQSEVATWAQKVFDRADGSRDRAASDPLKRTDGTENWYANTHDEPPPPRVAKAAVVDPNAPATTDGASGDDKSEQKQEQKKSSKKKKSGESLDNEDGTESW